MRDVKNTPNQINFTDYFPFILLAFVALLIVGVFLLAWLELDTRADCIQAAAQANYTAEQTALICSTLKI